MPAGSGRGIERRTEGNVTHGRIENLDLTFRATARRVMLYGGLYLPNYYLRLLQDMPATCGCRFQQLPYPSSADESLEPNSVLVIGHQLHDMRPLDAAVTPVLKILRRMVEQRSPALASIGLMYLGDDTMQFPIDFAVLDSLAWVYHQMWRPDLRDGKQDYSYLLSPLAPSPLAVADAGAVAVRSDEVGVAKGMYWIPLGPAHTWRPFSIIDKPMSNRSHLFFFMDKVDSRWSGEMVDALLSHSQWPLLQSLGVLKSFKGTDNVWNMKILDPHHFVPIQRSLLYDSQYLPCPRGLHPETARIWEALEAGVIPILSDGPEHEILAALDMGIVFLENWSQLPSFLLSVTPEETEARGARVRERYSAVKAALRRHLLAAVCQLQ